MPYEDEDLQWGEPDPALNDLAGRVIGAAIEVHRRLGPGLDEALYEAAMAVEMVERGISFERQALVPVIYKGAQIGDKRLDFIIEGRLVLELKAVEQFSPVHQAQVRTYLRITNIALGLIINFNVALLKDGINH